MARFLRAVCGKPILSGLVFKWLTDRFARITHELAKLRGKGLIRKSTGRNLYTLTDLGYRVVLYFTKSH